uniref:Uncharacterized protein n=1 Tax=Bracoviriform congregatae TaxID=39640 RepID=U3UA84_9VIRU|nr:hypothetical protein CcBV_24.2 [Bracoviriform congregatae]
MAYSTLKKFTVVEFSSETDEAVFMYVPRSWITSYSERKMTVVLPRGDESLLELDPAIFNMLPLSNWPQYEGKRIYETDSVEEAWQITNSKNNALKEAKGMMISYVAVVTSVIKEISDQLQRGNQHGPSTSLNRYIADVVRINRSYPVINEKLGITNQTDFENIQRLKTFSNNYAEFFQGVINQHINSITANMKSASPSADDVMAQNVKILNELMSTFIVVLCVMNGNIS